MRVAVSRDLDVHCGIDVYNLSGLLLVFVFVRFEYVIDNAHVFRGIYVYLVVVGIIFEAVTLNEHVFVQKRILGHDLAESYYRDRREGKVKVVVIDKAYVVDYTVFNNGVTSDCALAPYVFN